MAFYLSLLNQMSAWYLKFRLHSCADKHILFLVTVWSNNQLFFFLKSISMFSPVCNGSFFLEPTAFWLWGSALIIVFYHNQNALGTLWLQSKLHHEQIWAVWRIKSENVRILQPVNSFIDSFFSIRKWLTIKCWFHCSNTGVAKWIKYKIRISNIRFFGSCASWTKM